MSLKLEDYQELLEGLPPEAVQVLHTSWMEATKAFSARGLDNYLKAASAINQLGRGAGLVIAWLEEAPHVGKEQFGVTVAGYFHVTSAGRAGGYANRQLAGRLFCHRPFDRIKGYPARCPLDDEGPRILES